MDGRKHVQFVGTKPSRSMLRFVERQISRWIGGGRHPLSTKEAEYEVKIEREETYPYYECDIEVRMGGRVWHSLECGRTLHEALTQALKTMTSANVLTNSPIPIASSGSNPGI